MSGKPDDLEAVRAIVTALQPFDAGDQERILRWVREKVGLTSQPSLSAPNVSAQGAVIHPAPIQAPGGHRDLRAFISEKKPASDTHFATAVAYYYRFEAPESEQKDAVSAEDIIEACRKAGRARLQNPGQTLRNAHRDGLLDRADRGTFRINAVGENLVAMTLPSSGAVPRPTPNKRAARKVRKKKA